MRLTCLKDHMKIDTTINPDSSNPQIGDVYARPSNGSPQSISSRGASCRSLTCLHD